MRVLIIRLGAFGDIVHTLPLAADLARAGCEVGWCCEDRWADVLRGSPAVARIHLWPRAGLRRGPLHVRLAAAADALADLRRARYQAVIDAHGLAKSALITWLSGIGLRAGHAAPRARELSWLVPARRQPASATHVIDQQRGLGACLGVAADGPWRFPLPAWREERAWAAGWLAARGLERPWVLNVGAGWPTKVWPIERQIELARKLAPRPLLLAWGNAAEGEVAYRIAREAGHGAVAPDTSIPRLAGLLSHAGVMVSGDTGPLHLARALGIPAVGLFGPVPAERNGPQGERWINLQAPGAAWERKDVSRVDMAAITAAQVLEAGEKVRGR